MDPGVSGGTLDRPGLNRLLQDAEKGCFGKVLVYKTDRLSRLTPDIVKLVLKLFPDRNIAFAAITEPYDTSTPAGRMFFTQLASFADFERETIRSRTIEGKRRMVREGKWMGSNAHYAYDIDENRKLVINERRVKIFRQMVKWLFQGKSCRWIAKTLNESGVPTWKQEHDWKIKKSAYFWRAEIIRGMLINPIITGKGKYSGIDFEAPAILTEDEFKLVKSQLAKNRTRSKRNTKKFYLLRGLLYCKRCGSRLYGHKKPPRRGRKSWDMAYSCPSGRFIRDIPSCGLRRLNLNRIESLVWETMKNMLLDSEKLRNAIETRNIELFANDSFSDEKIREYDEKIKGLQAEKNRILALYGQSAIFTIDELESRAEEIQVKIQVAEQELSKFTATKSRLLEQKEQIQQTENYFRSIGKRLDSFTEDEKGQLISLLISRIVVDWDEEKFTHTIEIEGVLPIVSNKGTKEVIPDRQRKDSRYAVATGQPRWRSPGATT